MWVVSSHKSHIRAITAAPFSRGITLTSTMAMSTNRANSISATTAKELSISSRRSTIGMIESIHGTVARMSGTTCADIQTPPTAPTKTSSLAELDTSRTQISTGAIKCLQLFLDLTTLRKSELSLFSIIMTVMVTRLVSIGIQTTPTEASTITEICRKRECPRTE